MLCADFDEGSIYPGWGDVTTETALLTARLVSDYVSPPSAARFGVGATSATGYVDSQGSVDFPGTVTSAHAEFDVKIESLAPAEEFILAFIQSPSIELHVTGMDAITTRASLVEEGPSGITRDLSQSPPIGRWVRMFVDVMASPPGCIVKMRNETGVTSTVLDAALSSGRKRERRSSRSVSLSSLFPRKASPFWSTT